MDIKVRKRSYDIDESVVIAFEKKHNLRIPDQYRQFLIQYNVASVEPFYFFIKHVNDIKPNDSTNDELGVFFGFAGADDPEWDLEWRMDIYVDSGRLSTDFLPIATDGAGNPICIGVADAVYGKIFIWWHEKENDLTCLADDFDSFLNSLRDD